MNNQSVFQIIKDSTNEDVLSRLENLKKVNPAETNEEGQTPLHIAVLNNQLAAAAILLHKGFSPNAKDKNLLSPFIAAAANGLNDMFLLLLQYLPDATQVNRFGGTALLPSSEKGFIQVVQSALDYGVPVNHVNRLGWTALLEAVILGNEGFLFRDIIEELINHKANPLIVDFNQKTAIDYAKERNSFLILPILEQRASISPFKEIKGLIRNKEIFSSIIKLLDMPVSSEQIYYLGFAYEALGEFQTAEYYYKKGSSFDNQFYYYLANLSKKMNQVDQAIVYFKKGAESKNDKIFYDYHLSNYLRELGCHDLAIKVMDILLQTDEKRVDYLFHKANSLRSTNHYREAYEVMLEANRYQPNNDLFKEQVAQLLKYREMEVS